MKRSGWESADWAEGDRAAAHRDPAIHPVVPPFVSDDRVGADSSGPDSDGPDSDGPDSDGPDSSGPDSSVRHEFASEEPVGFASDNEPPFLDADHELACLVYPDEAQVDAGLAALLIQATAAEAHHALIQAAEHAAQQQATQVVEATLVRTLVQAACAAVLPVNAGGRVSRSAGIRAATTFSNSSNSTNLSSVFGRVSAVSAGSVLRSLGTVFDELAISDRAIATATAARARLVDEARVLSEIGGALGVAQSIDPSEVRRWSTDAVARRSLVSEVACTLRLPDRSAMTLIEESRALVHTLPATFDALTAGTISYRHAQVIIDQVWSLPADETLPNAEVAPEADLDSDPAATAAAVVLSPIAEFEKIAVSLATELTVAKFSRKARVLREHAHPLSIDERYHAVVGDRTVTIDPSRDGMAWLSAYLPAVQAYGLHTRLTNIASTLKHSEESRTLAQLRADVLTDLLCHGTTAHPTAQPTAADATDLSATDPSIAESHETLTRKIIQHGPSGRGSATPIGDGIRATVMITVPVMSLLGRTDEPASLEGYGPIDLDTARQLTAEAPSLIRLLTHPETGAVLSVGRTRYTIPNDLRLWLRVRDVTCRYPGCCLPAATSDLDHTLAWQHGGTTDHTNLAYLCPAHHDLKHHTGWSLCQNETGTVTWTSPTAHRFTSQPATVL